MKIGFFTDTYLPASRGIDVSVETFRESLEKMGHQVYVYAQRVPGYKDENPNVFRFTSVRLVKEPAMRFVFPIFPWPEFKKAMGQKLDIVHIHTPFSVGFLGRYIAKKQKIPLVYTHHARYPSHAKLYFKEKYVLPYLAKSLCGWFANSANSVIAPSSKIKEELRTYYNVRESIPIYVILTSVDLNKFKQSLENRKKLRKDLNIDFLSKVLLFVGSINAAKNSEFLFDVASEIIKMRKDTYLIMAGDGELKKELSEKAKKLKLDKYIKLVGSVPHEKIPQYYQSADLFLFTSLTDTQGIVLLEAMATGIPVICLKDDAFDGVVIDGKNGYVISKPSIKLFAQKINQLLDSPDLFKQFSLDARQTALKFSRENETEKIVNIYKKVINQP